LPDHRINAVKIHRLGNVRIHSERLTILLSEKIVNGSEKEKGD
jgi:hypothetical protein